MKTFTDDMRDFLLKKSHYLYRLENGTLQELVKPYTIAKQQLLLEIGDLQAKTLLTFLNTQKLQILNNKLAEMQYVLDIAGLEAAGKLNDIRRKLISVEHSEYIKQLNSKFSRIGIVMDEVPYSQLDFIMNNPMLGQEIGSKFLLVNQQALNGVRSELYQSVILGEDMSRAAKRLLGVGTKIGGTVGNTLINRARMIARTEIMHVSNSVNRSIYNNNQDVLKGLMYTATLDTRTCMQCAPLDGQVYKYKDGEINAPLLPLHPFCRCVYSPVTYSWQELQKKHDVEVTKPSDRDYFSGRVDKPIMTYSEWFNDQHPKIQMQIMGKKRYKAWLQGEFKLGTEILAQVQNYSLEQYKQVVSTM